MNKKAVTLVEILISSVLLTLIILGASSLMLSGRRNILHWRRRITAGEIGKYFLAPLQLQVRQDQWGNNWLSNVGVYSTSVSIGGFNYTGNYNITTVSTGSSTIPKVRLRIQWYE
ncbi:MAG: hypothetical protein NC908_02035 [Candidatus Omnitrophica bacterium]|nr:hypothetical protein [Candidatus Omnitrophota bacterium]